MSHPANANFPPGDQGPKLLGSLISFTKNEPLFTLGQFRKFGPVFSTTLANKQVCFLAGAEGLKIFYDEEFVLRAPPAPPNLMTTTWGYDGAQGLPPLDGDKHRQRKHNILRTTSWEEIDRNVGDLGEGLRRIFAEWRNHRRFSVQEEADRSILGVLSNVFFSDPLTGQEGEKVVEAVQENFRIFNGGLKIDLPFTRLGRSQRAADEVLYPFFQKALDSHRAEPERFDDAVTTYLAGDDVGKFTDGEILTDFHQFFIGGYGISSRVPSVVYDLAKHPQVVARLQQEIRDNQAAFDSPPTVASLNAFTYADQVVRETLRMWPAVPLVLGEAARDISLNGFTIPRGSTVFGCLYATSHDGRVYEAPDTFDPDRFSAERNEGADNPEFGGFEIVFGAGDNRQNHRCAGLWVALVTLKLIVLHLAHTWQWELDDPDVEIDLGWLPVTFDDGLKLRRR